MSLEAKRKKYDIPEIPYAPIGKNVLIWRIEGEEKTAGGLYVPETSKEVKSRGVLLAAGLAAMDIFADNLVEVGDEVCFAHYAGRERDAEKVVGGVSKRILECKAEDVLGSVDAIKRSQNYRLEVNEDNEHYWRAK